MEQEVSRRTIMVEPVKKLVQSAAYLLKGQEISVARVDVEPGPGAAQYHASSRTDHGDKGKKSVNFFNTAVGILTFLIKANPGTPKPMVNIPFFRHFMQVKDRNNLAWNMLGSGQDDQS